MKHLALCAPIALLALSACVQPPVEVGRALYADNCAQCHGAGGKGDGPMSRSLLKAPPDITGLTRANGGVFPQVYVMGVIDGYTRRADPHSVMPEFGGDLQAGDLVMVNTGDGIITPTPERLVALAAYLEGLQE